MSLQKVTVFTGTATALITPFRDGEVDYPALRKLIEFQISSGISAILVAGTTGEAATLSFREHGEVVAFAKEVIGGRVPLLAGCGSNCTSRAADLAHIACEAGADALLSVTPYYNKTSDRGILLHYEAICSASTKPVIIYNVPSRTGFRLKMEHYRALADMEKIVGVKEASGDLSLFASLCTECSDRLDIYTGNDEQTVPAMQLGGMGVISVYSNVCPQKMCEILRLCFEKDWRKAYEKARAISPQIAALFREVNPIPVKYVASEMGFCLPEYRLPLCPPSPNLCKELEALFSK